jgi:hypothetical protein
LSIAIALTEENAFLALQKTFFSLNVK